MSVCQMVELPEQMIGMFSGGARGQEMRERIDDEQTSARMINEPGFQGIQAVLLPVLPGIGPGELRGQSFLVEQMLCTGQDDVFCFVKAEVEDFANASRKVVEGRCATSDGEG